MRKLKQLEPSEEATVALAIDASSNTLSLLKFHVAPANCESFLQPLQYAEFGVALLASPPFIRHACRFCARGSASLNNEAGARSARAQFRHRVGAGKPLVRSKFLELPQRLKCWVSSFARMGRDNDKGGSR